MEIFGSIERLMSDLYPYRYALMATAVLGVALLAGLAWWRGWHLVARRHPKATVLAAVVTLAIALPLGNYLLSPLWTRTTLVEESPLALVSNPGATSTPATDVSTPTATQPATGGTPVTMPATEPPSGGQAGDEMPTATPAAAAPGTTEAAAQATQEPAAAEPEATEAPQESEPVATAVPPAPEPEPEPEPEPVVFQAHVTHSGEFYGADDFHFGHGTALIIQVEPGVYVLRFEDFSVRNGPDLRVYLSTNPDGYSANDYLLGELKATDGSFNYDIPGDVDVTAYRSVIIWCEPFAVLFAVAPLNAVAP